MASDLHNDRISSSVTSSPTSMKGLHRKIPAPKDGCVSWEAFRMLLSSRNSNLSLNKYINESTCEKAQQSLTWEELEAFDFENKVSATLALIRALALLDTDRAPSKDHTPKAYLLIARSSLWLAKDFLFRSIAKISVNEDSVDTVACDSTAAGTGANGNEDFSTDANAETFLNSNSSPNPCLFCPSQTVRDELLNNEGGKRSLAKFASLCIQKSFDDPQANKTFACALLAVVMAGQVANDKGPNARPAMAEAWLVAAESELMMAETEAIIGAKHATGIYPPGRWVGPRTSKQAAHIKHQEDNIVCRHDGNEVENGKINWVISIPGILVKPSETSYLADYWWGQTERVCSCILSNRLLQAMKYFTRYKSICDKKMEKQFRLREVGVDRGIQRRGAASLANLDYLITKHHGKIDIESQKQKMLLQLRQFFPGTQFNPTEAFVRKLKFDPVINFVCDSAVWSVFCLFGASSTMNRTFVSVTDIGVNSRWKGMTIGSNIMNGKDPRQFYKPSAKEVYVLLLEAMAGAGDESRAIAGPPRRPNVVNISYRLRDAFTDGLPNLLQKFDVECKLDTEDNLRFACAKNGEDFETGAVRIFSSSIQEQTLVGQFAGICDLVRRSILNGRVGKVVRWHEDQCRWEIKLECIVEGERSLKIAVKPSNLTQCPQFFRSDSDYLKYRDGLRESSIEDDQEELNKKKLYGPNLEKLRAMDKDKERGSICAICQQAFDGKEKDTDLGPGHGTCLPCGHVFHFCCIIPWLTEGKMECPCCRLKL